MGSRSNIEIGRSGEALAASHLERSGYKLIESNFRTRDGEIDLIVAGADALVFCEVKTLIARSGASGPSCPLESVGQAKRAQVRRMATAWLGGHAPVRHLPELRFDAIGVLLSTDGALLELDHVENAF